MACFGYNTLVNGATGVTPYEAVFGVEDFECDAQVGQRMVLNDGQEAVEGIVKRLAEVHEKLQSKAQFSMLSCKVV